MTRHCRTLLALALGGASVLACTTDPPSAPLLPVVSVAVTGTPADNVLVLGVARTFTAEPRGPGGEVLPDRTVRWSSSAPHIATVAEDGTVETLALGAVSLRAAAEGLSTTLALEVREGTTVPSSGPGQPATLLGGLLTLTVPSGVAPAGSAIHARSAPGWPADDRLLAGTVVELGPAGTELASAITPGIRFDPASVPAADRPDLRLYAVQPGGGWAALPGASVDLTGFRVSGPLTRLSTVAVFRRAAPAELVRIAGDDQTVPRGSAVPIAPSVAVRDAAGRPVPGITVSFAPGAGGGQVTGQSSAVSGVDGVATLPGQWRLGSTAGTYTLIASITGGISTTFTATATQ
jgi:hypothetical protein